MKGIMKKYIIGLLIGSMFVSCKDFLDERQVSNLTQDFYNDEGGLEALINGLYVYARNKHEWDGSGARLIEAETDTYQTASAPIARYSSAEYGTDVSRIAGNINNFLGEVNSNFAAMGAYPHINNCNLALEQIDQVAPGKFGSDETFRNNRKAEVRFLRAWAYYLISNQLGDVPLLLSARREDNGIYHYPKASLEDIYKQIITDVRFAYEQLPPLQSDRGRITKLAAGHFLAKVYLNRAQAAGFQLSSETSLNMLYKGNVSTDLDSCIYFASEVINLAGGEGGLAPDYWTLFDPAVAEKNPHPEILWSAQFDVNPTTHTRFGNRSVNYHTGNYTNQSGVQRSMLYGRPFGTFKPTDWGYDNFKDRMYDSRYSKTFRHEYISNMPNSTSSSYNWNSAAANWWNTNKPADAPTVVAGEKRIKENQRAIIYVENTKETALDSAMVHSQPYQFIVRWVRSAVTGKYYYRLFIDGSNLGLATGAPAPYLSSKKHVDPLRGGSSDESNFNSEQGTRDAILMRLAETFLIRAEAYGRKGDYGLAVADINVIRRRAAFKAGEPRPQPLVEWESQAQELTEIERQAPYQSVSTTFDKIMVSESHFTPGTPEAQREHYVPTVTSKADMFIHFIYNEKAREFLSEGLAWEDLHNAGILYERTVHYNQMASDRTGLWPVASNTANGNGQDGNGKGQMQKHHTFRPWPDAFLVRLTDENGMPLDEAARKAYQNPGY
ncbi:hypothetical protein C5745_00765 [Sphingobacterium haloxyli]|uniref:RagB/SusD family nutrient uptake outer membrane protein n=2 Tax=Sphingobacterium haloxyli TaxID=2100533 RepID=A0A2S9J8W4_9SPHI|nr:hypothetical protein C5745_00765 [Sphingobacterium haloxyli]